MIRRLAVLATGLVVVAVTTSVLAACGSVGGPPVAGGGGIPPRGTIWFASGVTGDDSGTIRGLLGQSDTVAMSTHVWFIGHLTRRPGDGIMHFEVNGCQVSSLTCPGEMLPGTTPLVTSGNDVFEYGIVEWAPIQQATPYTLAILDSTGATLATGSVTLTPL
jgi:hypothetical protein